MRHRSVAVVIENDELLVVGRKKDGREYSVLPGGGVHDGERSDDACVRELREETGLRGAVTAELGTQDSATYFRVRAPHHPPTLGGPEVACAGDTNAYEPRWVPLAELDRINLVPDHARALVRTQIGESR